MHRPDRCRGAMAQVKATDRQLAALVTVMVMVPEDRAIRHPHPRSGHRLKPNVFKLPGRIFRVSRARVALIAGRYDGQSVTTCGPARGEAPMRRKAWVHRARQAVARSVYF